MTQSINTNGCNAESKEATHKAYAVKMQNGKIKEFDTHNEMMAYVTENGWNKIIKCGKSKYFNEFNNENNEN